VYRGQDLRNDDQITLYFLGELSTEEVEHFDRKCFSDSAFAESVFVVEDELIDRYVRNELSRTDRERFERFYLTTEARRLRVEVARRLDRTMKSSTSDHANPLESLSIWQRFSPNRALTRYALATLSLALVVIAVWLLIRNSNKEQVAQINPPANVSSPENVGTPSSSPSQESATPTATPAVEGPAAQAVTVIFTLTPGTHREVDAGERVIRLSPQTKTVELRFVIQNQIQPPYEIRIETVEGERVLVRRGLTPVAVNGRQVVVVRAPTSVFAARDYIGRVLNDNGDAAPSYTLRVTKTN
jgi:hypothetical protein